MPTAAWPAAATSTRSLSVGCLRSPAFLRSASSLGATRSGSPFVRLESAESQPRQEEVEEEEEDDDDDEEEEGIELEDIGSEADALSYRPSFVSPRSTDYCCAICIELLLRPVVLSCGHRLCRGCWVHVLQGSQVRVVASRTRGSAVCPLGRCEVKASVPEVDRDLESEMQSR